MTNPTLRRQRDAVFAAVCRYTNAAKTLGIPKEELELHIADLNAAHTTIRWLEENEATIRAAIAKKTEVAEI